MKRQAKVAAILWIVLAAVWVTAEPIASLRPTNYVNDFAGVLDASTQAQLNALCQQVDQKAQAQIAVVTVKSVDGQDVVSYAVALYQKWGIGAKGKDRGVLILLATQDHKYWTAVGYGLEPILPDGKVGGFGREMVPLLRSGDYAGAVTLMTARVASVIAQDAGVTLDNQPRLAAPRQQPRVWRRAGRRGYILCSPLCCASHFSVLISGRRFWTRGRRFGIFVGIAVGHAV